MNKKGYKPAIATSNELQNLVGDLNAYSDLMAELLEKIDDIAGDYQVTEAELKRDYGFTDLSLRLLERFKQLSPTSDSNKRRSFNLAKALKIRVLQPGVVKAKNIRTIRKHNNIVSIYRDYLNKITEAVI